MAEGRDTIKGRLRSLLNLNKSGTTKHAPSATDKQCLISHEFWLDIQASSPLETRLERIREATKLVESELLQDSIIKTLWVETKDLLEPKVSPDVRMIELLFIKSIIKGQYRRLGILRAVFFQALQSHTIAEDGRAVVQVFETLTDNGKDLELFEQDVGLLLLTWMESMRGNTTLLSLLVNIIKFNSSYLDQEVIVKLLVQICDLCNKKSVDEEKELALQVIDAVVCYSSLPYESLYPVTLTLCHILNLKKFCSESWKLMRKLLGTHLGHSCILTMCHILQNPKMLAEWPLLRSAIFFIGMGLWGTHRVKSLKHTPQSVLPSFQCALHTKNLELAFEVTLTIQRLIRKFGHELQTGTWDHVLDIVSMLLEIVQEDSPEQQPQAVVTLRNETHELITFIEKLYTSEAYDGSVARLFAVTETCAASRAEESVFLLIAYKSQSINPTKHNWIDNLLTLMSSFYTNETRTSVRLKALGVLWSVMESSVDLYEEELVSVLTSCFANVHSESDLPVKTKAISLMVQSILLCNEKVLDLLGLFDNILTHGWSDRAVFSNNQWSVTSQVFTDFEELTIGLVDIFKVKLSRYPGTHSAKVFSLLYSFLHRFYSQKDPTPLCEFMWQSRKSTFDLFLSLRANEKKQLYIAGNEQLQTHSQHTAYVWCGTEEDTRAVNMDGMGYIQYQNVMDCVLLCLKHESHWPVLESVLNGLRGSLQNKSIVLVGAPHDHPSFTQLEKLTTALCSLLSDSDSAKRKMNGLSQDFCRADLQSSALLVLTCLVSYHQWLDVSYQRKILRGLESGFTSRCARLCIGALTLCLAEMPKKTLLRVLPSVLLKLSQISATVNMATAVLELLATLAQLPGLYSNFVEEQYMSVFAVALQYTNPSKFSKYVVSLAHYVVGTWFAKCRMSFRPGFVSFITRNLHAANRQSTPTVAGSDDAIRNDLMETCIDTMARYTFSNCSTPPRRSQLARYLFDNGPTCTWLVGNKLITVTTSDVTHEKAPIPSAPSTPSFKFWPKPSRKLLDQQLSYEAPGKLQTADFQDAASSPRARHKSGGAVLRRSLHLSPSESRQVSSRVIKESSRQKIDFKDATPPPTPRMAELEGLLTEGWAEIFIRRPSGNTAWSMRIQNQLESMSDATKLFDILNLQPFINDIRARNKTQDIKEQVPEEEKDPITESQLNPYMDILTTRTQKENSEEKEGTVADDADSPPTSQPVKPTTLKIGPRPKSEHAYALTPSPSQSPLPVIRHRSHTVSTSKDCAVEAAAISAKRVVEMKKSRRVSDMSGTPSLEPIVRSSAEGHATNEHDSQHRHSGITSPCFVFLQLFQSATCTDPMHRPILLPVTPGIERAIQVLDMIPPYDTWATGVVYVGPEQGPDGTAILANEHGSPRYEQLLQRLGELVCLTNCDPASTLLSGLDTSGEDGDFTYVWRQDVAQMVFHVTTLMPNKSSDAGCKRRHIGNDYVIIVYDDDRGRYVPGCVVQGQFRSAEIIISPLDHETNHVRYVFHKDCVEKAIGVTTGPWLVSDKTLPILVRQLALHANMAAFVCVGEGSGAGNYTSKVLARLKQIKRIRSRVIQETGIEGKTSTGVAKGQRFEKTPEENATVSRKLEEFSDFVTTNTINPSGFPR